MRRCSQSAQQALASSGGRNLMGRPLWKFMWSGDFTRLVSNGSKYERLRVVQDDCWLLLKWEPAEFWGSEADWILNNWEPSGLLTAGPFPREGRFRVALKLRKHSMDGGKLLVEDPEPSVQWVEDVFPMILAFDRLDPERKKLVLAERERGEKADLIRKFAESRKLYKGAGTPAMVKAKEDAIERWVRKHPKGYDAQRPAI